MSILLGCLAMATKDCFGCLLTIAEARGRALLAGILDAAFDLASIAVMIVGAGAVIEHGITPHAVEIILAMMVTSFIGTIIWTKLGRKIESDLPGSKADKDTHGMEEQRILRAAREEKVYGTR